MHSKQYFWTTKFNVMIIDFLFRVLSQVLLHIAHYDKWNYQGFNKLYNIAMYFYTSFLTKLSFIFCIIVIFFLFLTFVSNRSKYFVRVKRMKWVCVVVSVSAWVCGRRVPYVGGLFLCCLSNLYFGRWWYVILCYVWGSDIWLCCKWCVIAGVICVIFDGGSKDNCGDSGDQ